MTHRLTALYIQGRAAIQDHLLDLRSRRDAGLTGAEYAVLIAIVIVAVTALGIALANRVGRATDAINRG